MMHLFDACMMHIMMHICIYKMENGLS